MPQRDRARARAIGEAWVRAESALPEGWVLYRVYGGGSASIVAEARRRDPYGGAVVGRQATTVEGALNELAGAFVKKEAEDAAA